VWSTSRPFGHDPIGTTHESHHRPRRRQAALGAGLALGFAAAPHGTAHAEAAPVTEEDSPQSDSGYEGNRVCGVGATLPDGSRAVRGDYSDPNCWPGAVYCPPVPRRHHGQGRLVIAQLNPRNLDPAVRAANQQLLTAVINADLPSRVGLDARKSIVFYDRAFPVCVRAGRAARRACAAQIT